MASHNQGYRTLLIILALILVGTYAVAELDTNDLDEICNTNDNILKRTNGNWDCSQTHYAQGWFHNITNHHTINISDTTTYFNVTGFTIDTYYGVNTTANGIEITKNSTYKMVGTMSFHGGNNGDYEVSLFVNGIKSPACAFHRTTSSTAIGDATMSCIFNCNTGDLLTIRARDHNAPAQDIDLVAFNFNIMEIQ